MNCSSRLRFNMADTKHGHARTTDDETYIRGRLDASIKIRRLFSHLALLRLQLRHVSSELGLFGLLLPIIKPNLATIQSNTSKLAQRPTRLRTHDNGRKFRADFSPSVSESGHEWPRGHE